MQESEKNNTMNEEVKLNPEVALTPEMPATTPYLGLA